jgi:prepilin-type N-terminal cleavage/methylation domain-containing protein/prepilin-type processing-associated H-X9-DG protein
VKKTKGFTLIELLVVIAIIALLLSVIMPSLNKSKEAARRVVCTSNMRQLAVANLSYAADNQDKIVSAVHESGDLWLGTLEPYYDTPDIKVCPAVKKFPDIKDKPPGDGRGGTIDEDGACYESWAAKTMDGTIHVSSYGMNGFAQSPEVEERSAFVRNRKDDFFGKSTVKSASSVPLVLANRWRQAWTPEDSSTVTFSDVPGYCSDNFVGWFVFTRHDDRNNMSFVDGHVERVSLSDLGLLKWHRQWKRTEFDIPWLSNR